MATDTGGVVMKQDEVLNSLAISQGYADTLAPETLRRIEALKGLINVQDRGRIAAFGREEQAKLGKFTDSILGGIGTDELTGAEDLLNKVVNEINGYNNACEKENKGLFSFFKKQQSRLEAIQEKYHSVESSIDALAEGLRARDVALTKLSASLEVMHRENLELYNFLTMLIYAGDQVLQEENKKLQELKQTVTSLESSVLEAQRISDREDYIKSFERRLYDLKVTRTVALQQGPQIRMIQKNVDKVSETIRSTLANAIPIWKNQMLIALGMEMAKEGADLTSNTISSINQSLVETLNRSCGIAEGAIAKKREEAKRLEEKQTELRTAVLAYTNCA